MENRNLHPPAERPATSPVDKGRARRLGFLVPALLAVLAAAPFVLQPSGVAADKGSEAKAPARPPLPVEAAPVTLAPAVREVTAIGTLQSNESVVITDEIAGRVSEISFTEGERVAGGEILLRLDPSVLEAERDRARANLALSEANYKRMELLLKENAVSERERDEAYARLRLDEANLRLAEAQLAKMVIRAPFHGVLGLRRVSVGGYLRPGDPIVTLDDIDPIKVDFRVPEIFAQSLEKGRRIALQVDAVPGRTFEGEVYAIDPQIDVGGRSVLLRARVGNEKGPLRPGMFARVTLVLEERRNALMIPEEALVSRGDSQMVFKVVDGKVEEAPVTIGLRKKGQVEILEGLVPQDTVITGGQIKVRPGMAVKVLPPAQTAQNGD